MTQDKGEPAKFLNIFGEILGSIHSDYKRNTSVRGVRVEFLREVEDGIYISQNAYCRKGTYYHCFCLSAHKELPKPYLWSPFTVGGRFDHNYTIQKAMSELQKKHVLMSSTHNFRIGWESIVEKCAKNAEEQLLPCYVSLFLKSKKALFHLAEYILKNMGKISEMPQPHGSGFYIGNGDCDMTRFVELYNQTDNPNELIKDVASSKADMFNNLKNNNAIRLPLFKI